jgi:hypothetical protein
MTRCIRSLCLRAPVKPIVFEAYLLDLLICRPEYPALVLSEVAGINASSRRAHKSRMLLA